MKFIINKLKTNFLLHFQHSQMEKKQTAMDLSGLDQKGKIIAEYIWLDGSLAMRGKARTLTKPVNSLADLPEWNFDGS